LGDLFIFGKVIGRLLLYVRGGRKGELRAGLPTSPLRLQRRNKKDLKKKDHSKLPGEEGGKRLSLAINQRKKRRWGSVNPVNLREEMGKKGTTTHSSIGQEERVPMEKRTSAVSLCRRRMRYRADVSGVKDDGLLRL